MKEGKKMRAYSIPDLLVDTYYSPMSLKNRYNGGTITFAEKRDDVWAGEGFEVYRVRYGKNDKWATVAVKVED